MNPAGSPMRLMSSGPKQGPVPPPPGRGVGAGPAAGARILIVEDEYFVALTIEDALVDAGHDVLDVVASGEAAIAAAIGQRPDLVVMDIRLAGELSGIDAALELRRHGIPSIFATAHSDEATMAAGAAAQPAGWLVKPFSHTELISAVTAALTRIRSN